MRYIKEIVFSILLLFLTLEMFSQSPRFSFSNDSIVLETLKSETFEVYKGSYSSPEDVIGKKNIIGSFTHNEVYTRFMPLLPFQKGDNYTVVFKNEVYSFLISVEDNYDHLQVEMLYPKVDVLPSNFLKWYIQFSKPVNPSKIYDHIYLMDMRDSTKVDRALLPLETPLLSKDGKLLTLWIEPGRQKRDLGPNRELGEVLTTGRTYALIIDDDLKDINGIAMEKEYVHPFKVVDADRTKPSITSWEIDTPKPETKEPLQITFKDFLDYGSLKDALLIIDESGVIIDGHLSIDVNKKNALFTPVIGWRKGKYIIHCDPVLEDLAGNNLERLFDQDITVERGIPVLVVSFIIE